jgi:heme exporter protein C
MLRTKMHRFASPAFILRVSLRLYPWLRGATGLIFAAGLYLALFASPPDYQQGETVRIMYVHVPAAWMALFIYGVMAAGSFVFLVFRHSIGDVIARASGWIGAWFALLTLVTGSLWGKPMWGAWWVWDARLTSMLVLFFLYLGYALLARQAEQDETIQKSCAVLALVGAINLPVIKFSVEWWQTLHQPASVFRLGGPAIDSSMLWPLLVMALAFTCFYFTVVIRGMHTLVSRAKLHRLRMRMMHAR